jgi:DICT domain-containing protein
MIPGSILDKLRTELGADPPAYGVYYKNTLVALCHALEDHVLACGSAPLVLTAFQRGKWYAQEARRYHQIAPHCREVLILAVPDSGFDQPDTPANLIRLGLDDSDPVAIEWHLVILAPTYAAMVMCQELSEEEYGPAGYPEQDLERKFYGFWTFEEPLVRKTVALVIDHVERYDAALAAHLRTTLAKIDQEVSSERTDLSGVVSRVVSYLQTSQQQLVQLNRQGRSVAADPIASAPAGGQDRLDSNLTANRLQAFLRMAQRIDAEDRHNPRAAVEVSGLVETLAQLMHLPFGRLRRLRLAALLHRTGLGAVPEQLADPDHPTTREILAQAAQFGAGILRTMPELRSVARIVEHQQEWWDGSGLPEGLRAEEIPLEARILGLAAYFQELLVTRDDRPARAPAEVLALCEARAGTRWDPRLLEHLGSVVRLMQAGILLDPVGPIPVGTQWLLHSADEAEEQAIS